MVSAAANQRRMAASELLGGAELVETRRSDIEDPSLKVLFVTNMWPDRVMPHYGPFIASQARSLEAIGISIDVLAIRGYVSSRAYVVARRPLRRLMSKCARTWFMFIRDMRP